MIDPETRQEIANAAGLLVDTSLMVLAIVASLDVSLVERFKRTNTQFEESDAFTLNESLALARTCLTTPHVLAEASNHLGQLKEPYRMQARGLLLDSARVWDERWLAISDVPSADVRIIQQLGVADWGLLRLAAERVVVLTTDAKLVNEIWKRRGRAINFNHLRSW